MEWYWRRGRGNARRCCLSEWWWLPAGERRARLPIRPIVGYRGGRSPDWFGRLQLRICALIVLAYRRQANSPKNLPLLPPPPWQHGFQLAHRFTELGDDLVALGEDALLFRYGAVKNVDCRPVAVTDLRFQASDLIFAPAQQGFQAGRIVFPGRGFFQSV